MHKIIFYPVSNGDTSHIVLENEKRILFDFLHHRKAENEEEPNSRIDEFLCLGYRHH